MVLLGRNAPKLLSTVRGKRHATDKDHEEPLAKRKQSPIAKRAQQDDINAEPVSSDDDIHEPPSRSSKPLKVANAITKIASEDAAAELKRPERKIKTKPPFRVPAAGSLARSRTEKNKLLREDKENTTTPPSSVEDNVWGFEDSELTQPAPKKQKKTFASKTQVPIATNIHAKTPSSAGKKPIVRKYGKSHLSDRALSPDGGDRKATDSPLLNDEDEEFLNLETKKPPDPDLRKREVKLKRSNHVDSDLKQPTLSEAELYECLGTDAEELSQRSKTARLINQLSDWKRDQTPKSSQPDSSAPQEPLENIDDYLNQLPQEEEEGTQCPLCKSPVPLSLYWTFWKGLDKTIKNQNAFCHTHRKSSAQESYLTAGYPQINWPALPTRILKHKAPLLKILTGSRPSSHRDRYTPLALTGKAASLPKFRKDLPQHIQRDLETHALDDQLTYPGYYGARGRRIITESVMKMLKNEIKSCTDAVVQASGPAAFVQAVLVPEAAILLIMEDCKVGREDAEGIRGRTVEMGCLLNEEIEDWVEGGEGSEEEGGEYGEG